MVTVLSRQHPVRSSSLYRLQILSLSLSSRGDPVQLTRGYKTREQTSSLPSHIHLFFSLFCESQARQELGIVTVISGQLWFTDRTALVQWANTTHYRPGPEQSAAPDRQIVATAKRCPLPLPWLPGNLDVGSIVAPPGLSASPCAHSSSLVTIVSLGCSVCLWLVFLWQRRNCYHSHTRL